MNGYSYSTVVKIDKSTLPKDGQKVRFEIYNHDNLIGTFIEEEDMFLIDGGKFHYIQDIFSWEPLNEPKPKEKLDLKRIAKLLTIRRSILIILLVATIGSLWPESKLFMTGLVFIVWIISMHRDKLLTNRIK